MISWWRRRLGPTPWSFALTRTRPVAARISHVRQELILELIQLMVFFLNFVQLRFVQLVTSLFVDLLCELSDLLRHEQIECAD